MKTLRTIISIVFVAGTIAIIIYDGQTTPKKAQTKSVKADSSKADSTSRISVKK